MRLNKSWACIGFTFERLSELRSKFVPLFDLSKLEQMLGGFVGKEVFWNWSKILLCFLSPSPVGVRLILDEKRDLGPT